MAGHQLRSLSTNRGFSLSLLLKGHQESSTGNFTLTQLVALWLVHFTLTTGAELWGKCGSCRDRAGHDQSSNEWRSFCSSSQLNCLIVETCCCCSQCTARFGLSAVSARWPSPPTRGLLLYKRRELASSWSHSIVSSHWRSLLFLESHCTTVFTDFDLTRTLPLMHHHS